MDIQRLRRAAPPPSRFIAPALAVIALVALTGCSITGALAAATPGGGRTIHDEAFGADPRQRLDVYTPRSQGPAPVVVFVYGGSWQMGSKAMYAFVGQALAAKGYVAVIPDYRVYPQVRYPEFLRDNALAVRWARDNAARFGGDPKRLFLMGHSAGAYDVAMLTLDRRWLSEVGMVPARDIRAAVGLAGPYDFLPLRDPVLKTIFGPEQTLPQTQPIAYVDGKAPPMLLLAGAGDKTVEPSNSVRLGARIRERGGEAEVKIYKRIGHAQIVGSIAAPLRFLAPTLKDATAFMAAHDGAGGQQP